MKSEWHENFDEFHKTTCGFLSHPKAKITKFGDKQASKIRVRTKYFFIRCTRATNLETWAPHLEWLGARRAPWNFYSGNQLWGLGALVKMLGSPKGSLKFSLEHSLALSFFSEIFYHNVAYIVQLSATAQCSANLMYIKCDATWFAGQAQKS